MTKQKSTKRALLSSAIALFVCVAMLIGTTFAWFTDSVTSKGNKIQAGTLKIDLQLYDTDAKAYKSIKDSKQAIFDYENWEPGYTDVKLLKVVNEGTLALKWMAKFVSDFELTKLAEVIDVYVKPSALELPMPADRADLSGWTKAGTVKDFVNTIETTTVGTLMPKGEANSSAYLGIALKMREEAGNEYQGMSLGGAFDIMVLATQYTYEKDSFNNQYDFKATYLNQDASGAWLINNIDELYYFASEVNSGNTYEGQTVKLTADIDLGGYRWIPIGRIATTSTDFAKSFRGTFDGQNHTVSNLKVTNEGWAGLFGLAYKADIKNVTVKNATINSSRMAGAVVGQLYGNIENCHVADAEITLVPNAVENGYDNGDKLGGIVGWLGDNGNNRVLKGCTAKNVTLKGYRDIGGISGYIASSTSVEDCAVDTITITVDQATNHYGVKAPNAGGVIGRTNGTPGTIQNNTEANVKITIFDYAGDSNDLKDALADGKKNIVLDEGEYTLPTLSGKEGITIIGAEDGSTVVGGESTTTGFGGNFGKDTTIKNVTFSGSSNGVRYSYAQGGTSTFENCTFAGDGTYGFHIDQSNGATFIFNNCTFSGFNAFASDLAKVTFNNCTFLHNGNYGHTNIWSVGEFNNCTWGDKASVGTRGDNAHLFFNGVEESYHHEYVGSSESLFAFADSVNNGGDPWNNQAVILTADIDLKNEAWTPIGQTGATEFKGIFDGNGYTIKNLSVDNTAYTDEHTSTGLFGWAESGVTIKNVKIDGATMKGNHNVAAIVGYTYSSKIINCHVSNATIINTHANGEACGDKTGTIVGYAGDEARITNCSASDSTVKAGRDAGQLIGAGYNVSVSGCSATNVTVSANGDCTGANINNAIIGRVLG